MKQVGYMSGTFDLFHIGHLNILKKASEACDELIVGVHESGAWKGKETFVSFEERIQIVESIRYVHHAVKSYKDDTDAISHHNISKLFVGSDYVGSDRFIAYEKICSEYGVEIIYFPYTASTSSSQLRAAISKFNVVG